MDRFTAPPEPLVDIVRTRARFGYLLRVGKDRA